MSRFYSLFFVVTLLVSGFIPSVLNAQSIAGDISIDMVPLNPNPGETVTLTATSYGADLTQSTLSWNYNGRTIASGIGITSVSVIAPAAGTVATATVVASGMGQGSTASILLRPASVDLLWEAVGAYVPPFYKGKALLPVGGLVRVTAIPTASAPKNLSFDWSRNGTALQNVSGNGKSSMYFQQSALTPAEKIDVTARSGGFVGSSSITLAPHTLGVVAYQNKEGYIDYAKGYDDTISLSTPGVVLHFEPYYFSVPQNVQHDLTIDTTVDGNQVHPTQENELGLSRPASGGTSTLALAITTVAYSLQHLEKTFTLLFN